jgi:hypothetical protein
MKRIILQISVILMTVLSISAQNEKKLNFNYSLDDIKKIVITVNDNIEIENIVSNYVECELRFTETGKVIGISNKDELEDPSLVSQIKDSILYISPKERESLFVFGISTYNQDLLYRFKIPSNIPVEIKSQSKCYVNGNFKNLDIDTKKEAELYLSKDQIKYLNCVATRSSVKLDGSDKGMNYFYESTGNEKYIIKSESINVQFK